MNLEELLKHLRPETYYLMNAIDLRKELDVAIDTRTLTKGEMEEFLIKIYENLVIYEFIVVGRRFGLKDNNYDI